MKTFVSWSGGKETFLACYRAMQNSNIKVSCLLNMLTEDGKHSRSHGISSNLMKLQAEAMGIPLVQRRAAWQTYENEFKKAVLAFKNEGIKVGVFGDIDLQEHRDWIEKVCKEIGIRPILPLWKRKRKELLKEFIQVGFKAIVVVTNVDFLGKEWLGREINKEFIEELRTLGDIDLCGEKGEYHTFVTSGPIFKKKINILKTKKINRDKHWFLDILEYEITGKT